MRALLILLPILIATSCTRSPERRRVDRHDRTMTDSALSVLSSLTTGEDTVVKTRTIEKVRVKTEIQYREAEPVRDALMMRLLPMERRGCDTVYIRDTVYLSR